MIKQLSKALSFLETNQADQIDIVTNTRQLAFSVDEFDRPIIKYGDTIIILEDDLVRKEICSRSGLPYMYFHLLFSDPSHRKEFVRTVGYWLRYSKVNILIRTYTRDLEGGDADENRYLSCRSFLSNKYHIINHYDAVKEIVGHLKRKVSKNIVLSHFSPESKGNRMAIELDLPDITPEDVNACIGVFVANSELGRGIFEMHPYLKMLDDGIIYPLDEKFTRVHIGKEIEHGEYSGGSEAVDFTMQTVSDLCSNLVSYLNSETIENCYREILDLSAIVPSNAIDAFEKYTRDINLSEAENVAAIKIYLSGDDKSAWSACRSVLMGIKSEGSGDNIERQERAKYLAKEFGKKRGRK